MLAEVLRRKYENAIYHVMNRGKGRRAIFHGDVYYEGFLETLAEVHERFGALIHGYGISLSFTHRDVKRRS